jgi:hypothetical protein
MKKPSFPWTLGGLLVSAVLWAILLFARRWKAARFFASLAAAFFTKWGEARLARKVNAKLADAGFPAWTGPEGDRKQSHPP